MSIQQSQKICIWANYPGEILQPDQYPFFPNADYPERSLSAPDVSLLMTALSALYQSTISVSAKAAARYTSSPSSVYEVLIRDSVVLTTYLFFDRLLRLHRLLSQQECNTHYVVASPTSPNIPNTMSELANSCDGSQEFNQYVLSRMATIWQLPLDHTRPLLSNVKNTKPISNHNFDHTSLPCRIIRKLRRLASARYGKFPALSLTNVEDILLDNGVYGAGKFAWVPLKIPRVASVRNGNLRHKMEREVRLETRALFFELCYNFGINNRRLTARALIIYARMLTDFFPVDRLEGANAYRYCENYLRRFPNGQLWFSGMPGEKEIYWIAAAKKTGMKIIGVQHGVHYGFSKQPCFVELEYVYCDAFATWGWNVFPDSEITRHIHPLPLPSPWLSQRKKKWSKRRIKTDKAAFDVLLMTDRLQCYPPSLTTLRMSRLDFLKAISQSHATLVDYLCNAGISILHKPFNYISKEIQLSVINNLCARYPAKYVVYEKLDKGLTTELLKQCHIIIWDEPGTGFFECLIAGVPTMVYWPRITSHEEPYARNMFAKLEAVGLVHGDLHQLAQSIKSFLIAQEDWKRSPARQIAIREALQLWAKTDKNWSRQWKKVIATL